MNDMVPTHFDFEGHPIRVIERNGDPWFVASDACSVLGHGNPSMALQRHVLPGQRNTLTIREGIRGNPERAVISEGGLYMLILRSNSSAEDVIRFQWWVTNDVLPALRKHGEYTQKPVEPAPAQGFVPMSFAVSALSARYGFAFTVHTLYSTLRLMGIIRQDGAPAKAWSGALTPSLSDWSDALLVHKGSIGDLAAAMLSKAEKARQRGVQLQLPFLAPDEVDGTHVNVGEIDEG